MFPPFEEKARGILVLITKLRNSSMPENKITTELTPEQKALIPVYREWHNIAVSTERAKSSRSGRKQLML